MQNSVLALVLLLVFGAVLGAIGFRIRGGMLGDRWELPGQISRLIYGIIMAAVIVVAGWPWPFGLVALVGFWFLMVLAWFAGAVVCGTFRSIDAGRNEGSVLGDFGRNAARGIIYALPPAALLAITAAGFDQQERIGTAALLPALGAFQSMAYEGAWRLRTMEQKPTELGEYATGALLGVGAVLAVAA
jgi:hypothetical protein